MGYEVKARTNGIYFVEFADETGARKRVSLGTRDPKAAEQLGREKYIAHFRGETEPTPATTKGPKGFTLGDAFEKMKKGSWHPDNCSSWPTVWSDCKILMAQLGDVEVSSIQAAELQSLVERFRTEGLAPGTIKKRLSRLRTVLLKCATAWINPKTKRPYLPYVPEFPVVGGVKPRKVELTEADERRVYEYCDEKRSCTTRGQQWWLFKQFIMWQIDTGMRKSETLGKTMADIRGDVVILRGDETKNEDGREIVLTTRLQRMVDVFRAMDVTGPMFAGLTNGKVFEMWDEVRRALDLGNVVIHDLRHTRGQRLADADVPLEVIADLLGHRDVSVTASVYTFRKTEKLRKWTQFAENVGAAEIKEQANGH